MVPDLDLTINQVNAPTDVTQSNPFSISVDVTADPDAFAEGTAYKLYVYVDSLGLKPLPVMPIVLSGTLQAAPWTAPSINIPIAPITAGSGPDIYVVTASLLVGPSGAVFQASPVSATNMIVVH
jgi:hypothetical protein